MPSQGVLNRERVGQAILHAARTHAQEVGERLQTILAVMLEEGETFPDMILFQHLLARFLERRLEELVAADEAHLAETDDDHDPRTRREEACDALRKQIAEIRDAVRVVYGSQTSVVALGLDGVVPDDPLTLHQHAAQILRRLREPVAELSPTGLFVEGPFNLAQTADALQPKIDELRRALSDVKRERFELESATARRQECLNSFQQTLRGVGRTLQGCCLLAGQPELACTIRLTPASHSGKHRKGED